jgi:acylpyruvate hydrolase
MRFGTLARAGGETTAAAFDAAGAHPIEGFADAGALLAEDDWRARAEAALAGPAVPFAEEDLRRPVAAPGAVICVGLNYRNHILEMGRELPQHPTLFGKLARALTDPFAPLAIPAVTAQLDHEAELAVVIGRAGRSIDAADAWDHVAGLSVLNDITARDYQARTLQWFAGKNFEASTPWGPWIVTAEEFGDPAGHEISLRVDGETHQRDDLGDLVFGVPDLIADISRIFELRPGDLIATGTPGGVGKAAGRFLAPGNVVETAIEGIGTIRNTIVAAAEVTA